MRTAQVDEVLGAAWQAVLNRPASHDDDFFRCGGDSVGVARLVAHLRGNGVPAHPADVLTGRTFGAISTLVGQRAGGGGSAGQPPDRPATGALLPAQARWIANAFASPDQFSLGEVYRIPDPAVDRHRIRAALEAVVARHEALRTAYRWTGSGPGTAQVLPEPPDDLLTTVTAVDAEVPALLAATHRRHHLASGRVTAATWLPEQRLLHVALHHLTLDGYAVDLVADDLERELRGEPAGPPVAPPRDYAATLAAGRTALRGLVARWREQDWAEVAPVPTDRDGPALLPSTATVSRPLAPVPSARLANRATERGVPLDLLVAAAAVVAIRERFGSPAVSVDMYHHNRAPELPGCPDLTGTVGYLQATYPVVLSGAVADDWLGPAVDTAARVPSQRYSFDALRFGGHARELALPSSLVRLNFRARMGRHSDREGRWLRPAGVHPAGRRSPRQREPYRLMLEGDLTDEGLLFTIKYSRDLYRDETIIALADRTVALLGRPR